MSKNGKSELPMPRAMRFVSILMALGVLGACGAGDRTGDKAGAAPGTAGSSAQVIEANSTGGVAADAAQPKAGQRFRIGLAHGRVRHRHPAPR